MIFHQHIQCRHLVKKYRKFSSKGAGFQGKENTGYFNLGGGEAPCQQACPCRSISYKLLGWTVKVFISAR